LKCFGSADIGCGSQDLHTKKEKGLCIIVLGSIRSPKSQSDSEERNILDREVAEPQEGRGAASGGIRAIIFLQTVGKGQRERER
jgi:hypothetical protein